jgi:hypothetical protein
MEKAFQLLNDVCEGIQMTFSNGCTISVIFGKYTYSDEGQTTAEVAAWSGDGDWMLFQEDRLPFDEWIVLPKDTSEVMPRQTANQVANLIYTLSKYSTEE